MPRTLSRSAIRDAALALVDEQGIEALTMRALGARLGVKAASLYYHVPSRAALLRLIADHVATTALAATKLATGGGEEGWRPLLGDLAAGLRRALRDHPGAAAIVATQEVSPEVWQGVAPRVLAVMRPGLRASDEDVLLLVQSLYVLVTGLALAEFGGVPEPPAAPPEYYNAWFDIAVTTLLDGIAARYARSKDM